MILQHLADGFHAACRFLQKLHLLTVRQRIVIRIRPKRQFTVFVIEMHKGAGDVGVCVHNVFDIILPHGAGFQHRVAQHFHQLRNEPGVPGAADIGYVKVVNTRQGE